MAERGMRSSINNDADVESHMAPVITHRAAEVGRPQQKSGQEACLSQGGGWQHGA